MARPPCRASKVIKGGNLVVDTIFGVYGASGFGRETMPLARAEALRLGASVKNVYFVDDNPQTSIINGHPVVGYREFTQIPAERRVVALAIADSKVRERLAAQCELDGVGSWSLKANNSVFLDEVDIGKGFIFSPFSMITSNVRIGSYFHANIYSYVAHDCIIGDFVTFAPGVKCNGNVIVEDHAYIGTGAVIKQGKPGAPIVIGRGAVVGMGAVVTKSVGEGEVVVGNPARILTRD